MVVRDLAPGRERDHQLTRVGGRCPGRGRLPSSGDVPTYDYRCRDCGHTIEIVHSILEDGPEACERCRGPVERVLHPAGVIFRGSGFYVTDSRSRSSTEPSSGGSPPSGSSSDGKSDAGSTKDSGSTNDAGSTKPGSSAKDSAASGGSSSD